MAHLKNIILRRKIGSRNDSSKIFVEKFKKSKFTFSKKTNLNIFQKIHNLSWN